MFYLFELDLLFFRVVNILKHSLLLVIIDFLYTCSCQGGGRGWRELHVLLSILYWSLGRFLFEGDAHWRSLMDGVSRSDCVGQVVKLERIYYWYWGNVYCLRRRRSVDIIYWLQLYLLEVSFLLYILRRCMIRSVQPVADRHNRVWYLPRCARLPIGLVSRGLHLSLFDFGRKHLPVHVVLKLCIGIVCRLLDDIRLGAALDDEGVFIISFNFLQIFHFRRLIVLVGVRS